MQVIQFRGIKETHIGAWLLILILLIEALHSMPMRFRFFANLHASGHDPRVVNLYVWGFPVLFDLIYLFLVLPAWTMTGRNRLPRIDIQGAGLLALALGCALWIDYGGFRYFFPDQNPPISLLSDFSRTFIQCLVVGFFGALVAGLDRARKAGEERAREANLALEEARARLLASQMDPHVYFNLMGNIRALMDFDPDGAKDMLGSSATYTRQVMEVSQKPMISLGDERRMVSDYLEIQRIRLGVDRCAIQWDWPECLDSIQLPPILIQPMVENAIKHGIWPHPDGGELGISARMQGSLLSVEVRNTGMPLDPKHPSSVGLTSIRQRLELTYGSAAEFRLASEGAWTVAEIHIPVGTCES